MITLDIEGTEFAEILYLAHLSAEQASLAEPSRAATTVWWEDLAPAQRSQWEHTAARVLAVHRVQP